ncbi:hypothetical protein ACVW0B_000782 [Thermostichus sp. MS-CIW-23]
MAVLRSRWQGFWREWMLATLLAQFFFRLLIPQEIPCHR